MNNPNPHFQRTITLKFLPDDEQTLTFKLYDVDFLQTRGGEAVLSEDNFLGSYTTSFRAILEDDDNVIIGDLTIQGGIVIHAAYASGKVFFLVVL